MADQMATCVTHNRSRTMANLEMGEDGGYVCRSDSECKVSGHNAGQQWGQNRRETGLSTAEMKAQGLVIIHPDKDEACHAHGTMRQPHELCQVMTPRGAQWECLPESRCWLAGAPVGGSASLPPRHIQARQNPHDAYSTRYSPYNPASRQNYAQQPTAPRPQPNRVPGQPARPGSVPLNVPRELFCIVHQKKRSAAALEMLPNGTYRCTISAQCKSTAPNAAELGTCITHNKYVFDNYRYLIQIN